MLPWARGLREMSTTLLPMSCVPPRQEPHGTVGPAQGHGCSPSRDTKAFPFLMEKGCGDR